MPSLTSASSHPAPDTMDAALPRQDTLPPPLDGPPQSAPPPGATEEDLQPAAPAQGPRLSLIDCLLRDPEPITQDILQKPSSNELVPRLLAITACSAAVYGLSVGIQGGLFQAVSSGIKLPLAVLGAAGISLPLLHLGTALGGRRIDPLRLSTLVLQGLATATLTMACLAPLIAIGWLTLSAGNPHVETGSDCNWCWWVYRRVTLVSLTVAAIGGVAGASRLWRILPPLGSLIWTASFAIAGLQLTWLLRPVVGSPSSEFALLRPLESSGLHQVLVALHAVLL